MYTTRPQSYFFVSARAGVPGVYWCLYDRPKTHSTQKILERYITDAETIFSKNIQCLSDFKKPFTFENEKHLFVMLELLVDARKVWQEEATSSKEAPKS